MISAKDIQVILPFMSQLVLDSIFPGLNRRGLMSPSASKGDTGLSASPYHLL